MNIKTVYQTNHLGIYVGPVFADESPMEAGVFLIPGGCVEIPPPSTPEHTVAWWDGQDWNVVDYFGGVVVYSIQTGEPRTLEGLEGIPNGFTMSKPGPNQTWKNGEWVDDVCAVLASLYQEKLASIKSSCATYIQSGFTSTALGAPMLYSSALDDQINLNGLVLMGVEADYACYNADGIKAFRPHTAAQLLEVGQSLVRFKQSALQHADVLTQALTKALKDQSLKSMKAIKWTSPA